MKPFTKLSAIAAPLNMINVDTDMIIPKQFLKTIKRAGLGVHAFDEMRYLDDGSENPDFILNKVEYKDAEILIVGENFGCGSSREHAPWALLDMGFRCIIAPSFADIFYNNSFKNGILLIKLPQSQIDELMEAATNEASKSLNVDLEQKVISRGNDIRIEFEVDDFKRHCLLNGLDDIGLTLEKESEISGFERTDKQKRPWI